MNAVLTILLSLMVAVVTGIIAPQLLLKGEAKARREDKQQDYDRQDAVAAKAAEAATLLLAQQRETTLAAEEVARLAALANEQTSVQLALVLEQGKAIHTLVNSDMTAARQESLNLMRSQLVLLVKAAGDDPTQFDADEISALQERILKQEQILADRLDAQHRVEADQAAMLVAARQAVEGGE